jgi:hypothetical protein
MQINHAPHFLSQFFSKKCVQGIQENNGVSCILSVYIILLFARIPGQLNDRRTMLGELNWIFTAITDTIAWNTLPRG